MTLQDKITKAAQLCSRLVNEVDLISESMGSRQRLFDDVLSSVFMSDSSDEADGEAGEGDLRYLLLDDPSIVEHLTEPAVLDPVRMVSGRSYVLSPGQRAALRELTGMTPTKTVTIVDVRTWKAESDLLYLKGFTIKSDEHIDPRRKHVLSKYTIQSANQFFELAKVKDQEIADARLRPGRVEGKISTGIYRVSSVGMDPTAVVSTMNLVEGDQVLFRYDALVDAWKVTRCLEPKEVSGSGKHSKQPKLQDLKSLLDELSSI